MVGVVDESSGVCIVKGKGREVFVFRVGGEGCGCLEVERIFVCGVWW